MLDISRDTVIAVDGGGTRCRVVLLTGGSRFGAEVGSANVTTDFSRACREIERGISLVARQAGLAEQDVSEIPTYLGLAGMTGSDMAARVAHALPTRRVRVEDDRLSALRGALGRRYGAIAHMGTGSFFAGNFEAGVRLAGGWGPVLGDEASAQHVGRQGLRVTLDVVDGLVRSSPFTESIMNEFGSSGAIVAFAARATPSELGATAKQLTAAARQGDPVARSVLASSADTITRVLPGMGWQPGQALCLTGGIAPEYEPYLPDDYRASLVQPEGPPIEGAIGLALDFAQEVSA